MTEAWLEVPGFEGLYWVSDMGRVRSRRKILKPWATTHGYVAVTLRRDGTGHRFTVGRLVLIAFQGMRVGVDSCHQNGDKLDNTLPNLYWGTRSQNILDQVRHGRHNNARKTHCKRGHEFTPANTILRGNHPPRQPSSVRNLHESAGRRALPS